ncbi:fimbrial protein [Citrobacter sp. R56]|uniref:fimbrial protein n=1 Tax=Citrobacter sp. R56 TaxID=1573676 RepID=UPI00193BAF7D|nr:fimbrial protein [Citrobacter sp. R56]QRG81025.1 fimbrial protein [Citrobacter sp. R56]
MRVIKLCFLFMLCTFAQHACACWYAAGGATKLTINMGNITTQSEAGNGVLATASGLMTSFGGAPAGFYCGNGSKYLSGQIGVSGDNSFNPGITYATNIPGIGVKIYYYSSVAYKSEPTSPVQTALTMDFTLPNTSTMYQNKNAAIKVELVKTGPVSAVSGGSLTFTASNFMVADNLLGDESPALDLADLKINATITVNTCNVDATSPTRVDLEPADANTLPRKGATTGDTPFEIRLKCTGKTDVNLLLDGQEDTDVTGQGVLAIKKTAESAKGIGLQLLYNDLPVELEKEFSAGMSAEGTFTIPLTARYYRTTEIPVKAGDVSATVVYSLTYK